MVGLDEERGRIGERRILRIPARIGMAMRRDDRQAGDGIEQPPRDGARLRFDRQEPVGVERHERTRSFRMSRAGRRRRAGSLRGVRLEDRKSRPRRSGRTHLAGPPCTARLAALSTDILVCQRGRHADYGRRRSGQAKARVPSDGVPRRAASAGRVTASAAIYRDLREAIAGMELVPGTSLHEKASDPTLRRQPDAGARGADPPGRGRARRHLPAVRAPSSPVSRSAPSPRPWSSARRSRTSPSRAPRPASRRRRHRPARRRPRAAALPSRSQRDVRAFHEADEAFHEAIAAIARPAGRLGAAQSRSRSRSTGPGA